MKFIVPLNLHFILMSPSPRRAWIEMIAVVIMSIVIVSPSPRRAWIEILSKSVKIHLLEVALPTEGVD